MVRKLKFHERKLLKKVDFINWDDNNLKEVSIMKRYGLNRVEYTKYNKLVWETRNLANKISELPEDVFRVQQSDELTEKLFNMGLIKTKRLIRCNNLSVKSFARRRLPVFMIQSGMFNGTIDVATKYVEHGHVRVGPHTVKDPAFLVTKNHEDFLTWTDTFRKKIDEYNNVRDDYQD